MSSLSLVRYRTNDYSVPVAYGHRDVLIRGYVDRGGHQLRLRRSIATQPRSYERDDFVCQSASTTCRSWSRRRALWTKPRRSRDGTCPRSTAPCAGCWNPGWADRAKGSTSKCSGCWGTFSQQEVHARRQGRHPTGSAELRRSEAPGAVPGGRDGHPDWTWNCIPTCHEVKVSATCAKDYMTLLTGRSA